MVLVVRQHISKGGSVRGGILAAMGHLKPVRAPSVLWGEWLGDLESLLALSARHNFCSLGFIVFVIQIYSEVVNTREHEEVVGKSSCSSALLVS